ncbi:MAG: hypothetical protein RSB22_15370 [Acinetobacter sp.]
MGLLHLIKEDESLKFISLKEAINLLAEKTNSNIYEVATYLLNKNVHARLDSHARQNNYKIEATSSSMDEQHWYGENYCFVWLNYIAENQKHYPSFRVGNSAKYNKGCEENFWNRADFLNLDCIKDLNVFSAEEINLDKQQQYIWDTNYLNIQKNDIPDLDTIDSDSFSIEYFNFENCDEAIHQEIKKYPLFFKNDVFTVQESACLISNYDPYLVGNKSSQIVWLDENPRYVEAENFIYSAVRGGLFEQIYADFYVVKADILKSFLSSKELFIDGFNDNPPTQEPIGCGQPSIQQVEPNIENLNGEIVRLRNLLADQTTEIQDLKSKIQELETPPTIQGDNPDLLALIFDETQTDRYAPDLAYSIKLWLDVYVNNPKADSHNNKANTWIKNNTPYNGEQDNTPTRRVREIATPFKDLHISRKKLLENK